MSGSSSSATAANSPSGTRAASPRARSALRRMAKRSFSRDTQSSTAPTGGGRPWSDYSSSLALRTGIGSLLRRSGPPDAGVGRPDRTPPGQVLFAPPHRLHLYVQAPEVAPNERPDILLRAAQRPGRRRAVEVAPRP